MLLDEWYINAVIHLAGEYVPPISGHVSGPFKLDPHHARTQQVLASLARKGRQKKKRMSQFNCSPICYSVASFFFLVHLQQARPRLFILDVFSHVCV